jgi:hypothetical protein
MPTLQRTWRLPGPLLLITIALLSLRNAAVHAHDPGLSSLHVNVNDGEMSASLTIAASDLAALAPAGEPRHDLSQFARSAVYVSVDDEPITPTVDHVFLGGIEARVILSFGERRSWRRIRRLSITSEVAKRIGRGHRQLVVLSEDGRVINETLLDSSSGPVAIALEGGSSSAGRALWLMMIAMGGGSLLIRRCRTTPNAD